MFYFGTHISDFKIESHINSRYGFKALFFTNNIEVAELYAKYHATKNRKKVGYIYRAEFATIQHSVDFNSHVSHSSVFRNLVHSLQSKFYKTVKVKNVYDYPSEDMMKFIKSDIIIIFDFNFIHKIEMEKAIIID
jgi:hypothetical protein